MITGQLNFMNLKAAIRLLKGKDGGMIECVVLPIEANNLFKGEKGLYFKWIAFELSKPAEGSKDTHLIKQSFDKEKREEMGEEQIKALPIVGNLRVWEPREGGEPVSSMEMGFEDDGLPF